jgi:phosphoribosylcarboxyaminoimidazole (NCAIR) mutase
MTKFAEVRVGSDSDLPKLELLFQKLNELKIPYIQRILSAHRTPGQMAKAAKEFPEVFMPHVSKSLDQTQMNIKLCFAAAG